MLFNIIDDLWHLVFNKTIEKPETIATAIRIGNPVNKIKAEKVKEKSNGLFLDVTDEEILKSYKLLAKNEGIFCEPASAASLAGLIKTKEKIKPNSTIVCVLTGNGLKDPDCAIKNNDAAFYSGITPEIKVIAETLGF